MTYTLYFSPDSANLVIRMVLEELRVGYEEKQVARKRSERSADFFALNPRGLLPVLIDHETDASVFETGAILLYLADKHGALAPKPNTFRARGACLRWLFMLSNTLHADLAMTFYAERYANSLADAKLVHAAAAHRVLGHLELLNRHIDESEGEWFLGAGLSICDFYLGCCVRWAQLYPADRAAVTSAKIMSFSSLVELLRRTERRPSVKAALEKERIQGPAFIQPISPLPARVPDGVGAIS
ncbi:MAG: glutathione S-transferase family protein [Pseudomonadota bacterium]